MRSLVTSNTVLWGQTLVYTFYALAIIALVGWFATRVTRTGGTVVSPKLFYTLVAVLITCGVSLHLITYNTIPWTEVDLNAANITSDTRFDIRVADHRFILPSPVLEARCGEITEFNVTTDDLTYGFGLFRPNNSMVFQMQVVPGHANVMKWEFAENGTFTIRSTEYSGPDGAQMIVPDAVRVTGCQA